MIKYHTHELQQIVLNALNQQFRFPLVCIRCAFEFIDYLLKFRNNFIGVIMTENAK